VAAVELGGQGGQAFIPEAVILERHVQLAELANVAQVRGELQLAIARRYSLGLERGERLLL
jgi:hypothetical protein